MVSRYERGQALLEFALTLPIMLLLLVGILDLGRIVLTRNGMSDGARLGAREASIDPRQAGYCARVDAAVRKAILDLSLSTYTVNYYTVSTQDVETFWGPLCSGGAPTGLAVPLTGKPGDRIKVVLGTNLNLATPLISSVVGRSGFPVVTDSTMNVTFAP
jgi:hypothetical protein